MGSRLSVESKEKEQFAKHQSNFWKLIPEARQLLVEIGERLVIGQERYGGFKFDEYDLDQMSVEEIEDFIVYIVAKHRKKLNVP